MDKFNSFFIKRGRDEGFGGEDGGNIGGFIGFLLEHEEGVVSLGLNKIFEAADNAKSIDDAGDTDSNTKRGEKGTQFLALQRRAGDGVIRAKQQ